MPIEQEDPFASLVPGEEIPRDPEKSTVPEPPMEKAAGKKPEAKKLESETPKEMIEKKFQTLYAELRRTEKEEGPMKGTPKADGSYKVYKVETLEETIQEVRGAVKDEVVQKGGVNNDRLNAILEKVTKGGKSNLRFRVRPLVKEELTLFLLERQRDSMSGEAPSLGDRETPPKSERLTAEEVEEGFKVLDTELAEKKEMRSKNHVYDRKGIDEQRLRIKKMINFVEVTKLINVKSEIEARLEGITSADGVKERCRYLIYQKLRLKPKS